MQKFIDLKSEISKVGGTITAHVDVPADSVWFDGHFPGEAILPGVAQLAMVVHILCIALGKSLCVTAVRRVRFKQAIRPDERIEVQITPEEKNRPACGFRLLKGTELACSGFLDWNEI